MSIRTLLVAAGLLASATFHANADAVKDTTELWEALKVVSVEAMASLEIMGEDPAGAAAVLNSKVKRPITAAQMKWWDAMSDSEDKKPYYRSMACYNAANTLGEISGDLVRFLEGRSSRPDIDYDVETFHDYLEQCEVSVTGER